MDETTDPDDDPVVQCEPEEDADERTDAPASDERTPEEAGYGYGV